MTDDQSKTDLEPTLDLVEPGEPDPRPVEWFRENSIPITGVVVLVLILSLVSHLRTPVGWSKVKEISDVWLNLAQFLALCLGGWWFCFKFIKGRAYRETLVIELSGQVVKRGSQTYLIVVAQLENVGQSAIQFAPYASLVQVFSYIPEPSDEIIVNEKQIAYFVAFKDLDLEPGQIIQRSSLVRIPNDIEFALRIELEVFDGSASGHSWSASKIIVETSDSDASDQQNWR
ncbi:MAG TPA: hypothetical protein VI306_23455 [Pyrinomonadaceae bacterium]